MGRVRLCALLPVFRCAFRRALHRVVRRVVRRGRFPQGGCVANASSVTGVQSNTRDGPIQGNVQQSVIFRRAEGLVPLSLDLDTGLPPHEETQSRLMLEEGDSALRMVSEQAAHGCEVSFVGRRAHRRDERGPSIQAHVRLKVGPSDVGPAPRWDDVVPHTSQLEPPRPGGLTLRTSRCARWKARA